MFYSSATDALLGEHHPMTIGRRHRSLVVAFSFMTLAAVGGCTSNTDPSPEPQPSPSTSPPPATAAAPVYTVLVTGPLKADEPGSKATHDQVVGGSKAQANQLGDIAHGAFLTADGRKEFLAIDRWTSLEGLTSFFGNPQVQTAFGSLLAAKPDQSVWVEQSDWAHWGDAKLLSGGGTKFVYTFRGHVNGSLEKSRGAHNQLVEGGRATANELGDVFHATFVSVADPTAILGIDVWTSLEGSQKFFSNPQFQQGSAAIYAVPPAVKAWGTTDWAQW